MSMFQAILYGAVQGLTVFFPVSGSAHFILLPWFFGRNQPHSDFRLILYLGVTSAVLFYFLGEFFRLARAGFQSVLERRIGLELERRQFWAAFLGSLPALVFSGLFCGYVDEHLSEPLQIAISMSAFGFLLLWFDGRSPCVRNIDEVKLGDALMIGIAQVLAVVPGVSRMGVTYTMARFLGLTREASLRFSLWLSPIYFPVLFYFRGGYEMISEPVNWGVEVWVLVTGFVTSFVMGMFAIYLVSKRVKSAGLSFLGWYRILLAALVVGWSLYFGV